jgi:hypothetical protein
MKVASIATVLGFAMCFLRARVMDNCVMRLQPEAVKYLLEILRFSFNSPVLYQGRNCRWDTIILLKAQELANYILGKNKILNFVNPSPNLAREDSRELREKILCLSAREAKGMGIRRNTLWYLKGRAEAKKTLKIYSPVSRKLVATAR